MLSDLVNIAIIAGAVMLLALLGPEPRRCLTPSPGSVEAMYAGCIVR